MLCVFTVVFDDEITEMSEFSFQLCRLNALEILKQVAARKRGGEEKEHVDLLMDRVGDALMGTADSLLAEPTRKELGFEGTLEEYGKCLCTAMVIFGEGHFRCGQLEQ